MSKIKDFFSNFFRKGFKYKKFKQSFTWFEKKEKNFQKKKCFKCKNKPN